MPHLRSVRPGLPRIALMRFGRRPARGAALLDHVAVFLRQRAPRHAVHAGDAFYRAGYLQRVADNEVEHFLFLLPVLLEIIPLLLQLAPEIGENIDDGSPYRSF